MASRQIAVLLIFAGLVACQAKTKMYFAPCRDQESQLVGLYERYAAARKNLVTGGAQADFSIDDAHWKQWLAPGPECPVQPTSIEALETQHRKIIAQARTEAEAAAKFGLDLSKIRADAELSHKFCAELPKGGLLHVSSSKFFDETASTDFARKMAAKGIHYLELAELVPPMDSPSGYTPYFKKADELSKRILAETTVNVRWKLLFALDATESAKSADLVIKAGKEAIEQHRFPKTLVGIEVDAGENTVPWLPLVAKFLAHPALPLKRSFTVDMKSGASPARDAMIAGATQLRLSGSLESDPVTLEWARRQNVLIDVRAQSKGLLVDYASLALPVALAGGEPDSDSTDFDLDAECLNALSESAISYRELKGFMSASIEGSFADAELKTALLKGLEADSAAFEERWRRAIGK